MTATSHSFSVFGPSAYSAPTTARYFSGEAKQGSATEAPSNNGAEGSDQAANDVAKLQAEIESLKTKLKESNDQRVYLLAEMENVRRIAKNDIERATKYAAQPICKGLLLAIDNLQIAVDNLPREKLANDSVLQNYAEGIEATLKIFHKVLGEHGMVEFGQVGEKFDPNHHEAVAMIPAQEGQEPNTLGAVMKTGFFFKDRVLRAAQVAVVSKQ